MTYVAFGNATHLPMQTVSYASKRAADAAVKRSLAEGWPARVIS